MTYDKILTLSAGLLNDSERDVYTNAKQLPYLNIARMELQEIFELNSIGSTAETSGVINVPAGQTRIGYDPTVLGGAVLPSDLVEIKQVFESQEDQGQFLPMVKKEFLTPYLIDDSVQLSYFRIWSWQDQEIRVPSAINPIDLKLNYIKTLFVYLEEDDLEDQNNIRNTDTYFFNRVAGLCARFIDHDKERADALDGNAAMSLQHSLGISIKGQQPIMTRRRPFRAGYKARATGRF